MAPKRESEKSDVIANNEKGKGVNSGSESSDEHEPYTAAATQKQRKIKKVYYNKQGKKAMEKKARAKRMAPEDVEMGDESEKDESDAEKKEVQLVDEQEEPVAKPKKPASAPLDPLSNEKIFWKVACPKYAMMLAMCTECRDANFRSGNRKFDTVMQRGKLHLNVTFTLCADCVQANFEFTDAYLQLGQRRRAPNEQAASTSNGYVKKWKQIF